ncbi:MAG: hypothetical protein PHE84_12900 [bacterium]|nr:hypothetical protein [bacterium]
MDKYLNYLGIFKKFNDLKIDYLVVGGLAVNFHGIPRMTYDVDLAVKLTKENILKVVRQLTEWGYKPKAPVKPEEFADPKARARWMKEKNMKAFNFYHHEQPLAEIDLVFDLPVSYSRLKANAVFIRISEELIPVIRIRDLIVVKTKSGRKQDLSDVENLKRIMEK